MTRAMTPERWREIEAVLQGALSRDPSRRDAYVAEACATDPDLRHEVTTLLAAHDRAGNSFLERPLVELMSADRASPPERPASGIVPAMPSQPRMVSARGALYAAAAMIVVGVAGGWAIGRTPVAERLIAAVSGLVDRTADAEARQPVIATPTPSEALSLDIVDRSGRAVRSIAARRPWTPRISPDGNLVAYGAFGSGRGTSDIWITHIASGKTQRLTDDGNDSNDPQWSSDGRTVAYSANALGGKDLFARPASGGEPTLLASRDGTQFASDWLRDGSALIVTDGDSRDILVQPVDGTAAWPYAATDAEETGARVSPNGRWIAYTSNESGQAEVYLDTYPRPGRRVMVSSGGGLHPVWRRDGRELYYWSGGALVAVQLERAGGGPPAVAGRAVLFRAPYHVGPNTMYDVSPDGQTFVIVREAGW